MKIGITTGGYLHRYGYEKGLERMRAHGYETLDYGDFSDTETPLFAGTESEFEKTLSAQRDQITAAGIEISQVHGPWRWPMHDETPENRAERFEKMAKSIRGTAVLGCKHFVIHNIMPFGGVDTDPVAAVKMNEEFFGNLLRIAEEYKVIICMENMPFLQQALAKPADMLAFVKRFDSPYMRMCLDTGHCSVHGLSPADAVRTIGKDYLCVMHVHDNDGKGDRHWLPYTGVIDWDDYAKALVEIGYEGSVSLETNVSGDPGKEDLTEAELALAHSALRIAGRA